MKNNLTTSEEMMFSTVKLTVGDSEGTGFILRYSIDGNHVPVICTNRHVLDDNQDAEVDFSIHLDADTIERMPIARVHIQDHWMFHPIEDLAICFAEPVFRRIEQVYNAPVFYRCIPDDSIADVAFLQNLDALEEVTMIGYPLGLSDDMHALPIFRRGYTASHPALDFNGERRGLIDIAGWPGSSGSPVFIFNQHGYSDRCGNMHLGETRLSLIGVMVAIRRMKAEGSITADDAPSQPQAVVNTWIPANLAYYIKAEGLLWFKEPIKEILNGIKLWPGGQGA